MSKEISKILQDRALPEHIKTDYPLFQSFVDAYFEYLEEAKNPHDIAIKLRDYRDIDETLDEFLDFFSKEVLVNIPKDIITDKRLLAKHIKNFYLNKGNESSYRFLFRILFNEDIEFYYPKVDVLRASDGKWFEQKSIKISFTNPDNLEAYQSSNQITGQTSNAIAIVESALNFTDRGVSLVELSLSDIKGTFQHGETIQITYLDSNDTEQTITETILEIITEINITAGGSSYSIDDLIVIKNVAGDEIAKGSVKQVTRGPITSLAIASAGTNYNGNIKEVTAFYALPGNHTFNGDYLPGTNVDGSGSGDSGTDYTAYTFDQVITLQSIPGEGDSIDINDSSTSFGSGAFGVVSKVGNDGEITEVQLLAEGSSYDDPTAEVDSSTGTGGDITVVGGGGSITQAVLLDFPVLVDDDRDSNDAIVAYPDFTGAGDGNATGTLNSGTLAEYPGRYLNEDGHLSSSKRLQDNFFYQDYSYVLKVGLAIDNWRDIIKKIIHPAGLAVFGEISLTAELENEISFAENCVERILEIESGDHSQEIEDDPLLEFFNDDGYKTILETGQTILQIGTSLTDSGYQLASESASQVGYTGRGLDGWVKFLTNQKYDWINKGESGDSIQEMVDRFSADVIAESPDIVIVEAGTNDAGAETSQIIIDRLKILYDLVEDNGYQLIPLTIAMRGDAGGWNDTIRTKIGEVNDWIKETYKNAIEVNTFFTNPATNQPYDLYTDDGTHWTNLGAYSIAKHVIKQIINYPLEDRVFSGTIINSNPTLTGTTGSSDAGISGTVPTGMHLDISGGHSGTAVSVANDPGLTMTFTPSGDSNGVTEDYQIRTNPLNVTVTASDDYELFSDISLSDWDGWAYVHLRLYEVGVGSTYDLLQTMDDTMYSYPNEGITGLLRTATKTAVGTSLRIYLELGVKSNATGTGTLTMNSFELREVV